MSFAIAIWEMGAEGSKSIHALDENMDVIWTAGSLYTGTNFFYSIVVDLTNSVLYNTIKGSSVNLLKIQKRSLTTGVVQATSADLDKGTCLCCVDADGRVWTVRPYRDSATDIIVYNTDLTAYKSVNVSGASNNGVYYLAVTLDSNYVYVVGSDYFGSETNYISKYSVANLYSGGAAEWEVSPTGSTGLLEHCCVDDSDNVYATAYSYDGAYEVGLWKVNSAGTIQWSGNPINGDRAAVYYGDRIYTPKDANDNHFGQYNSSTGVLVGSSADAGAEVWDVAVDASGNYVYGCCTSSTSIKKYDTNDWEAESPADSYTGTYSCIWYFGDPTGFVNYTLVNGSFPSVTTPPTADFSGTPRSGNATLSVAFTDSSTESPTSWSWDFGDDETSTDQNPTHDYTTAGTYTVALTATNAGGSDTETKTDYITVYDGTINSSLDELAVRLNDTEESRFPEDVKLKALNLAQLQIARWLKPDYLQDFEVIESNIDISSGSYALSSLTYTLILDEQGIFAVRVTIDETYWAYPISIENKILLENVYFVPAESVFWYVFQNTLYVTTSSDLSLTGATADVFYLKEPTSCTLYVAPDLSTEYYNLWMALAESYCWSMEGRKDRADAVGKMALLEINAMNERFKEIPEIVIGENYA